MSITCKQAVDYISKKEEGKLPPGQWVDLWRHFSSCGLCKMFYQQNKLFRLLKFKRSKKLHLQLSTEEKESIIRKLKESIYG